MGLIEGIKLPCNYRLRPHKWQSSVPPRLQQTKAKCPVENAGHFSLVALLAYDDVAIDFFVLAIKSLVDSSSIIRTKAGCRFGTALE